MSEPVIIRIGKKGITNSLLNELKEVLKKRKIVKVKLLRNFRETYEIDRWKVADLLSKKLGAKVVEIRGFTIILRQTKERVSTPLKDRNRKFQQ
ncbi:MAG: RNA-binding protein [Thermoprotei archaeon]|mgnify:CR=1 FL=1|nr:MAG: RNA-binding protein [Thermoprotei archaeon]